MKLTTIGVVLSRRNTTLVYQSCPLCLRKLVPIVQGASNSVRKSSCWKCKIEFEEQELVLRYHLMLNVSDGKFVTEVSVIGSCLDAVFGVPARQFVRMVPDLDHAAAAVDQVVAGRQIVLLFRVKNPPHQLVTLQRNAADGTVPLSSLFACFATSPSRCLVPTGIEFPDGRRSSVVSEVFRTNCHNVKVDSQLSTVRGRLLWGPESADAPLHSDSPPLAHLQSANTKLSVSAKGVVGTDQTQSCHMPTPTSDRGPFSTEESTLSCRSDSICFTGSTGFSQVCPAYASQSLILTQSGQTWNFDFKNDSCLFPCTNVSESSCLSGSDSPRFNLEGSCGRQGGKDCSGDKLDVLFDSMIDCWSPMEITPSGLDRDFSNQSTFSRSSLSGLTPQNIQPQKNASHFLPPNPSSRGCVVSHELTTGNPLPSDHESATKSCGHGNNTTVQQTSISPITICSEASRRTWNNSGKLLPAERVDCEYSNGYTERSCDSPSASVQSRCSPAASLTKDSATGDQTTPARSTGHLRNAEDNESLESRCALESSSLKQLGKLESVSSSATLNYSGFVEDALCLLKFDDFDESISDHFSCPTASLSSPSASLGDSEITQPTAAAGLSPTLFSPSPPAGSAGSASRSALHPLTTLVPETERHRMPLPRRTANTSVPYSPFSPDLFACTPRRPPPPRDISTPLVWLSPDIL